jgi:signal transduction histidine kinase
MDAKLQQEIQAAYEASDQQVTLSNIKVGCVLGMVLMPAGSLLDYFVYPLRVQEFLTLRLLCSLLIGLFLTVTLTSFGRKHYRGCGLALLMLPTTFMSIMIYREEGAASPYYAGLNLVLLFVGFVLHWTFQESLRAVALVLSTYLVACLLHGIAPASDVTGKFFNNLYFLVTTGVVVATGNYFLSQLRFQEFAGRYELDRNKQQLEESNRKLLELDQIKTRFFANISHELRTPLTLMLAPLENLLQRRYRLSQEESVQLLQTMHGNGMRLLKLINDLLELVRLDSGIIQVKLDSVEMGGFIRGLASAARQMADAKRLQLETSIAPDLGWVMVDRDKLEKIILNLEFNALKFTPAGGRVEISAGREGEQLVLRVADTGVGIKQEDLPNVFTRFWQADASSRRKYQGAGIGLAMAKELTELQGGTVAVQSGVGVGTTFTVRLPFIRPMEVPRPDPQANAPAAEMPSGAADMTPAPGEEWLANLYRRAELLPILAPAAKPLGPGPSTRGLPIVLVADDEPEMLRFLRMELQGHYDVAEAANGAQAVNEANRLLPDLILLDMMMPEKDGLQVCRELRERTPTRGIPILMLTARADEETKMTALSTGANDFLAKPFSTSELHARVKNLVESHQYQRSLARQNQLLENTIDQLKETETQLVQTEKLASLGRMSAGIIHEINNPLNYAKTGLYTLRQRALDLPPLQRSAFVDLLGEIEDGVNRVKNIVLELGPFSRQTPNAYDTQRVAPMVGSALRFLSQEWKDHVAVHESIPPELSAWANAPHVIQVLVNLLQNALDALKQKDFGDGKPAIWIAGRAEPDRCLLTIRDNGPGIPADVMPKIFEPFFTTKEVGAGMGLGLNICYRIMEAHRGKIAVRSEPGQFTEFTLEFPVKEPSPQNN